jgi:hypothetical protein
MKKLLNSFITKISNLQSKNEPTFTLKNEVTRKSNINMSDLSYEDYMKYSNQRPKRKPTRLAVD